MPCSIPSSRAQQRDVAEPEPRRGRRELGGDVVGGGEDDADDVVVRDRVALEHRLDQRLRLGVDLVFGVLIAGGRAAQSQDPHEFGD